MTPLRAAFISVVPSPYQRDLFAVLAPRPEIALSVFYMEAAAPDSPWPEKPLAPYEKILPGFWCPLGSARLHVNWSLPSPDDFDVVVMNTLISITAQRYMRLSLGKTPWLFWGEKLRPRSHGWRQALHDVMTSPLHRASGIVGIGSHAETDYHTRFPEPRHFCIPYYCDLDPFLNAPRPSRDPREVTFLFCGQMIARKGVDILMEAFSRIIADFPNAKLLLAGREADLPQFLATVPQQVRERITYAGFKAPEELPRYFAQADVFVLPSRYEGWGVVVNQALGAGLPVICSDAVGAGHDLVCENINGFKFDTGNTAALADKMRLFVREPGLCVRFGETSKHMAQDWLPVKGADKWIETLKIIANR